MPGQTANYIVTAIVVAIIAAGIAFAWFWQIAPTARGRRDEARLPHIGAAWFYFAAMAFFVVICGVLAQGLFALICKWQWPELQTKTSFGAMMSMGAFGVGAAVSALYARRLLNAMQTLQDSAFARLSSLSGAANPPPMPLVPIARSKILPAGIGVFCITWTAAQLAAIVWNWALDRFGVPQGEQEMVQLFRNEHATSHLLAMIFVTIAVAPVWEEIIFRGALFGYLRTRLPRVLAFVLPALIFAAVHFDTRSFASLLVFALIHNKAYERTGRIGVTIISHALQSYDHRRGVVGNRSPDMNPFSSNRVETVASLGEERLLERIRRWLGDVSPPAPLGIGDDCAVLPPPSAKHAHRAQAITVDPVIYGRHFDDTVPPRAVGAKLLKRNLSDLAAMGATPIAAVLALTLDPRVRIAWVEQFYRGLAACARAYRLHIVGGDVAQSDGELAASLTLLGRATTKRMLLRTGAHAGDHIYTTGTLGGSILGKHWRFTPRLAEGAWLASRREVRAMMDLSDGIAKDIRALTPQGARAELAAAAIPVSRDARRVAKADKRAPLAHAVSDGEDYELLFAVATRADLAAFEKSWRVRFPKIPLTRIGRFVPLRAPRAAWAVDLDAYHGYEHLRGKS